MDGFIIFLSLKLFVAVATVVVAKLRPKKKSVYILIPAEAPIPAEEEERLHPDRYIIKILQNCVAVAPVVLGGSACLLILIIADPVIVDPPQFVIVYITFCLSGLVFFYSNEQLLLSPEILPDWLTVSDGVITLRKVPRRFSRWTWWSRQAAASEARACRRWARLVRAFPTCAPAGGSGAEGVAFRFREVVTGRTIISRRKIPQSEAEDKHALLAHLFCDVHARPADNILLDSLAQVLDTSDPSSKHILPETNAERTVQYNFPSRYRVLFRERVRTREQDLEEEDELKFPQKPGSVFDRYQRERSASESVREAVEIDQRYAAERKRRERELKNADTQLEVVFDAGGDFRVYLGDTYAGKLCDLEIYAASSTWTYKSWYLTCSKGSPLEADFSFRIRDHRVRRRVFSYLLRLGLLRNVAQRYRVGLLEHRYAVDCCWQTPEEQRQAAEVRAFLQNAERSSEWLHDLCLVSSVRFGLQVRRLALVAENEERPLLKTITAKPRDRTSKAHKNRVQWQWKRFCLGTLLQKRVALDNFEDNLCPGSGGASRAHTSLRFTESDGTEIIRAPAPQRQLLHQLQHMNVDSYSYSAFGIEEMLKVEYLCALQRVPVDEPALQMLRQRIAQDPHLFTQESTSTDDESSSEQSPSTRGPPRPAKFRLLLRTRVRTLALDEEENSERFNFAQTGAPKPGSVFDRSRDQDANIAEERRCRAQVLKKRSAEMEVIFDSAGSFLLYLGGRYAGDLQDLVAFRAGKKQLFGARPMYFTCNFGSVLGRRDAMFRTCSGRFTCSKRGSFHFDNHNPVSLDDKYFFRCLLYWSTLTDPAQRFIVGLGADNAYAKVPERQRQTAHDIFSEFRRTSVWFDAAWRYVEGFSEIGELRFDSTVKSRNFDDSPRQQEAPATIVNVVVRCHKMQVAADRWKRLWSALQARLPVAAVADQLEPPSRMQKLSFSDMNGNELASCEVPEGTQQHIMSPSKLRAAFIGAVGAATVDHAALNHLRDAVCSAPGLEFFDRVPPGVLQKHSPKRCRVLLHELVRTLEIDRAEHEEKRSWRRTEKPMPGSVFGRKWREISAVVNSERFAGLNISPPMQCEVMRNDLDSECDRKLSTVNDKYRNECSARRLEWNIVAAVLTVVFDAQLGEFFVYINYEFAGNLRDLRLVKPDSRDIQDYRLHHPGRGIWKNTYLTCTGAGFRQHFRLLHLRHNYTIIARPHIVNWWGEAGTFRTIQFDGGKVLRRLLYWSTLADPGHRYWAGLLDCSFEQMKDCEMRAVQKVLLDARRSFAWINQSRYSFPENLPHLMCAPKEKDENGEGEEERALLMSTTVRPDEDLSAGLLKVKKNGVFKFKKDGVLKGSFGVLKVKKDGSARDKVEDLDSQSAADIIEKSAPGSSTGSPVIDGCAPPAPSPSSTSVAAKTKTTPSVGSTVAASASSSASGKAGGDAQATTPPKKIVKILDLGSSTSPDAVLSRDGGAKAASAPSKAKPGISSQPLPNDLEVTVVEREQPNSKINNLWDGMWAQFALKSNSLLQVRLRFVDMGGNDLVRAKISGRDGLVKNDRTQKMEVCEDYKTLFLHTLETCGDVAADTLDVFRAALEDESCCLFETDWRSRDRSAYPRRYRVLLREKVRTLDLDDAQHQEMNNYQRTFRPKPGTVFATIEREQDESARSFLGPHRSFTDLDEDERKHFFALKAAVDEQFQTEYRARLDELRAQARDLEVVLTTDAQFLVFVDEEFAGTLAGMKRWPGRDDMPWFRPTLRWASILFGPRPYWTLAPPSTASDSSVRGTTLFRLSTTRHDKVETEFESRTVLRRLLYWASLRDPAQRLWVGLLDETFVALTGRQKAAAKNLLNNARRICPYMNAARYGLQENLEHLVVVPAFGECEVAAARAERIVHVGLKPNGLEINNLGSDVD